MNNLKNYISLLETSNCQDAGMDFCHYMQIIGSLVAKKPQQVLEIGIGTALLTVGLVSGLVFNQYGTLICIDNWNDWHGCEPQGIEVLREAGVTVVAPIDERQFLVECPNDYYDFVVSDGDHKNSWSWIDEYFRITKHGGFIYSHDTNNLEMFPALAHILSRVKSLGLPHFHFTSSTRDDERCERRVVVCHQQQDINPFGRLFRI